MKRIRLELSLDLLREVNAARLASARNLERTGQPLRGTLALAEALLEQHDADARARVDVRQTSIFAVLTPRSDPYRRAYEGSLCCEECGAVNGCDCFEKKRQA